MFIEVASLSASCLSFSCKYTDYDGKSDKLKKAFLKKSLKLAAQTKHTCGPPKKTDFQGTKSKQMRSSEQNSIHCVILAHTVLLRSLSRCPFNLAFLFVRLN